MGLFSKFPNTAPSGKGKEWILMQSCWSWAETERRRRLASTLSWSSLQALRLAAARARSISLPHSNPTTAAVIEPTHDSVLDYRGVQFLICISS